MVTRLTLLQKCIPPAVAMAKKHIDMFHYSKEIAYICDIRDRIIQHQVQIVIEAMDVNCFWFFSQNSGLNPSVN